MLVLANEELCAGSAYNKLSYLVPTGSATADHAWTANIAAHALAADPEHNVQNVLKRGHTRW